MARRRMISQELVYDENFNSLSCEAQNLFIRMLAVSDDCGVVPAASDTLRYMTNFQRVRDKAKFESRIAEILNMNLGTLVTFNSKQFFLFKKESFMRFQSYIINKRTSSEYMKITSQEFDAIDWGEFEVERAKRQGIPVRVREMIAEEHGLKIGKVSGSQPLKCGRCGSVGRIHNNGFGYITLSDLNFDHIVPNRFGGSSERKNIQILCPSCNQKKKYEDIETYKELLVNELVNCDSNESHMVDNCGANAIESRKQRVDSNKQKVESKEAFGEFQNVFLTDIEYGKLIERLGTSERARVGIEILSAYKESKGKTYKSDYAAMGTWVIGELEKRENGNGTHQQSSRSGKRQSPTVESVNRVIEKTARRLAGADSPDNYTP